VVPIPRSFGGEGPGTRQRCPRLFHPAGVQLTQTESGEPVGHEGRIRTGLLEHRHRALQLLEATIRLTQSHECVPEVVEVRGELLGVDRIQRLVEGDGLFQHRHRLLMHARAVERLAEQ
jgi:hypothetical protein